MSIEELIAALKAIAARDVGLEERHIEADALLLAYIADQRVSDAYEAIQPKWYA